MRHLGFRWASFNRVCGDVWEFPKIRVTFSGEPQTLTPSPYMCQTPTSFLGRVRSVLGGSWGYKSPNMG